MEKILIIVIIAVCFIFQNIFFGFDWEKINPQSKSSKKLFFDTSSVKVKNNFVYYRVRTKSKGNDSVCWIKSDCKRNLVALLDCKKYTKRVKDNFYNFTDTDEMSSSDATSIISSYHNRACQFCPEKEEEVQRESYWSDYMRQVESTIKSFWEPPKQDKSALLIVKFNIKKDGEIDDLKIIESSNNPALDESGLEAIKKAAPFKPLPEEFKGEKTSIEFSFEYNVFDDNLHKNF